MAGPPGAPIGPSDQTRDDPLVLRVFYLLAGGWVITMLLLGRYAPVQYSALLQEDRMAEWGTVWVFLFAGLVRLRQAIRERRVFDGLVALFCLFVAGEEVSWGQRLLGVTALEYFLAHNYQQELTLHNLPQAFLKPKWVLVLTLAGYGVLCPLLARTALGRRLLARVGATAPSLHLVPGYGLAIGLLLWYPLTLTGEWVELLAGSLFLVSARLALPAVSIALVLTPVFAVLLTGGSGAVAHGRDAERSACARAEVQALLDDLTVGKVATPLLRQRGTVHKRVWTARADGYLDQARLATFDGVPCHGSAAQGDTVRRHYLVDPWGMSYWLAVERLDADQQQVSVYSFGPNRRRDGRPGEPGGDDISVTGVMGDHAKLEAGDQVTR